MRRTLLIILASLFMMTATELHQFLRIPFLIVHYRHHEQKNSFITILEFLKLHYTNNHPDDNDGSDDAKLPFKSAANINHMDTPLITSEEVLINPEYYLTGKINAGYSDGLLCYRPYSVFRPPRFA